jgi:hypothetical protein
MGATCNGLCVAVALLCAALCIWDTLREKEEKNE